MNMNPKALFSVVIISTYLGVTNKPEVTTFDNEQQAMECLNNRYEFFHHCLKNNGGTFDTWFNKDTKHFYLRTLDGNVDIQADVRRSWLNIDLATR
jgi:hypothetical protein